MSNALFGSSYNESAGRGAWLGGGPDIPNQRQQRELGRSSPLLKWCQNTRAVLKRERQAVTEEMKTNTALSRGETPWWRNRSKWKVAAKFNSCATVPLTWTAILCDAKPSVTYQALDRKKQRRADVATAAWDQAYEEGNWEDRIHSAVLVSQVQKKAYLSLRPRLHGDVVKPHLAVFLGEQVYVDQNASCLDEAEIRLVEYRESYGSLCARFDGLRDKLQRKYVPQRQSDGNNGQLAPPATFSFSGLNPGGNSPSVNNPAYAGTPNPPDGAAGSAGMQVWEFWTSPHKTIDIDEVQFLTSGDPATRPKMYETIDEDDEEPLRRITTEGGIIYELPQSLVDKLTDAQDNGGIKILSDRPALEAITHKVKYELYPDGRLVTVVDEDIIPDDGDIMNPLGYIPLVEISANADPGGGYYGPSSVDLIKDAYELKIRTVSGIGDNVNLMGNNMWRVWEGEPLSNDDFTNAPGSITRETINSLRYSKREPAPELPGYIMKSLEYYDAQIKDLSGLSDMVTGKMPPRMQVSTETMTMNQEASGVRFRDSLAFVSRGMKTLGGQFLEFMARFYTSPVIVQIKNNAGVSEPVPMLGAYLTDPYIVEAKAGSRQPSGPTARLTTLLNLKNAGVPVATEMVYDLLEQVGSIPSATQAIRQIETLIRDAKRDPSQGWKILGLAPPGQKPNQSKKPGSKQNKKQGGAAG
jgi:hypothetical protein